MEGDMEEVRIQMISPRIKRIQDLNYNLVQRSIDITPLGPDSSDEEISLVDKIIEAHDEIQDCLKKLSEIRTK